MTYLLMSAILLNIMPGPAMFYVAQQTLNRNSRAIALSIIGIEFGTLIHIAASTAGLTCLIAKWSPFHSYSKYISAGFLIYLGFAQLIKPKKISVSNPEGSIFFKGILINALNPKLILFFMTILPQFLNGNSQYSTVHIIYMGLLFAILGGVANIFFSLMVNLLITSINDSTKLSLMIKWGSQIISCFFIVFGIIFMFMR